VNRAIGERSGTLGKAGQWEGSRSTCSQNWRTGGPVSWSMGENDESGTSS